MAMAAVLLALVVTGGSTSAAPARTTTTKTTQGLVSTNPWAAAQPTAWGRQISAVAYFGGEIYVGYGDWNANTGPTHVTSWSPATGAWTDHLTADTEAIEGYRQIGSSLYVPMVDPKANTSDLAVSDPWREVAAGTAGAAFEHVFDAAQTADGLWLVGSKRGTEAAMAMRSTDGGTTWSESLTVPGYGNRFYTAAVINGVLHLQDQYSAYQYLNGAWVAGPLMASTHQVHNTVSVPGAVASVGYYGPGWLYRFDGTSYTTSSTQDWLALTKSGNTVYALRSGSVMSSTDLVSWRTVARSVPSGAISLAVGGGYMWFGTTAGQLWSAPLK